ncbi:MAG: signal peptide peptidase SppA [Clostridiales bacterium]|nr:signal peptide peptidase SppA [Clostridiales bacterium]
MSEEGTSPIAQAPVYHAPAPAPPSEPRRSGAGWKVAVALILVLVLGLCGCSALAFVGSFGAGMPMPTGDAVALLHIDGVIAGTGSVYSGYITPEYFVDQLDRAMDDPAVKAVLIRIDSPGGTVAASQEIAMEVARATKPVVVSVGDVCASGAYMVAAQADEIVATPTSSIGSIGVIAQIPNFAGLLDTLGVEFTVLTAGEHKDAGSPYRSLTATETALFQEWIDGSYQEFIRIVAEGRGLPEAEVKKMADGWLWPGMVAEEMGLIDSLGTFNDALARAAELGGIEGEPVVVTYREPDYTQMLRSLIGFGARLESLFGYAPDADAVRDVLPR